MGSARRKVLCPRILSAMYIADSHRLTNAGAKKMIDAATAKAAERGASITIAIVDAGGHLMLLERMEGGKFHTVHSATTKAACAASTRRMTTSQGQSDSLSTLLTRS